VHSECYVYAIVGRSAELPAARAGSGDELAMVPWRELAAVTGTLRDEDARLTVEAVRRHEAVVEAVRRQGPALPVRFGTVFRDVASVASALAAQYEPLAADLDRLGDKLEVSLTALWAAPPNGDAAASPPAEPIAGRGAGARYLQARAAELRRDEAMKARAKVVARELDLMLGAHALAQRISLLPTPRVALRATYLLDPSGLNAFKRAFEAALRTRGDVRVLLTGPWPPYSFVRRPDAQGAAAPNSRFAELAQLLADATRGRLG